MNFLFISGQEIVIVFLVILLFFGSKSIPDIARMLGKGMREFRKATDDIKQEIDRSTSDIKQDIGEVTKTIEGSVDKIKKDIDHINVDGDNK